MDPFREKQAIGQICSSNSMTANLAQCVKLVGQAANAGAKVRGNVLGFVRLSLGDLFTLIEDICLYNGIVMCYS